MELKDAIEQRRSIRKFQNRMPNPDLLIELVDAARNAPSSGNLQPWKFIIIKDEEKKRALADAAFQEIWISTAPVIIVVFCETEEVRRHYQVRGEVLYSIQDCAMAAQNLMLRATELGLSTTFVGAFEEGMVKRILNIPDHMRPHALIPVGYADDEPDRKLLKSIESMTYFEGYYGRTEDFDEAFYKWSGIMKKNIQMMMKNFRKHTAYVRDKVKEKLQK